MTPTAPVAVAAAPPTPYLAARAAGVALHADGDLVHWSGAPEAFSALRPELAAAQAELLEHLRAEQAWRVAAMRQQLSAAGAFVPFLRARPGPTAPGACISCGVQLVGLERARCALCGAAARQALADEATAKGEPTRKINAGIGRPGGREGRSS